MERTTRIVPMLEETVAEFRRHKSSWLAAAIAYFTLFAIAPLVIVVVEIAGLFLGHHQAALNETYREIARTAGPGAAAVVGSIVTATFQHRSAGTIAQIAGWIVFVIAAVGLFSAIQDALNTVWDVQPAKRSIGQTVKDRLFSFGMVLASAALLLISLGVNAALAAAGDAMAASSAFLPAVAKVADFAVSFALVTTLFALVFEYLPEVRIAWRDVWLGAAVSSLLFTAGQFLLGWYLGRAGLSSGYGTFGGLVGFLLWVYYSAQIMLLGAEFTHVYARRHGRAGTPSEHGTVPAGTSRARDAVYEANVRGS